MKRDVRVTLAEWRAMDKKKPSKYGNRKVVKGGETFDSVREYERHLVLLDMQKRGEIINLQRQVKFDLVVNGHKVGKYIADWTYTRTKPTCFVVDDAKGVSTPVFRLKWALMKALYPLWVYVLS